MFPLRVVLRNITRHPLRTLLTSGAIAVAVFLLAALHTIVDSLDQAVDEAGEDRVIVQSGLSLFSNLPTSYRQKIMTVPGVAQACSWVWFGAYYQDEKNFFAQFGVDEKTLTEVYSEIEIVEGDEATFLANKGSCLVGRDTADKFDFKVGQTVPLISNIFRRNDGEPWTFEVAGIYEPQKVSLDATTIFFHFDYLDDALDAGIATGQRGVSTYTLLLEDGVDATRVTAAVDALFENGPQATQTVPESTFNKQFVTMMGNVPLFVKSIGGGVLLAVLLACVNAMLLTARQQVHDIGIMKALGFSDLAMGLTLMFQSILIALIGGAAGLGLAVLILGNGGGPIQQMIPAFALRTPTLVLGLGLAAAVGLIAGIVPAIRASGLQPTAALRAEV